MRRGYLIFGRDDKGDEVNGPWWPLYATEGPLLERSELEAIDAVRSRLEANGEDDLVELAAVDVSAWMTAHGVARGLKA